MYSKQQVAATMDHAVLKPFNTDDGHHPERPDVPSVRRRQSMRAAERRGPGRASSRAARLRFRPSSAFRTAPTARRPRPWRPRLALEDGAVELDMVMNIGKFKSGDFAWVQRDIEAVVAEARSKAAAGQGDPGDLLALARGDRQGL